jgi:hypothetical protein
MSSAGLLCVGIALGIGFYALKKLQAGADATRVIDSATGENNGPPVGWDKVDGGFGMGKTPYTSNTIDHLSKVKDRAQKKHEFYVGGPKRHKIPTTPTQSTPIAGLVNNHD